MTIRQILDLVSGALLFTMAAVFTWQFYVIATEGQIIGLEPNPFILYGEIALFALIMGFGAYRIYYLCRKR